MFTQVSQKFRENPISLHHSEFTKLLNSEELEYFNNVVFCESDSIKAKIARFIYNLGLCKSCFSFGKFKGLWYDSDYPFSCCSKQCSNFQNSIKMKIIRSDETEECLQSRVTKANKTKTEKGSNVEMVNKIKLTKKLRYGDENYNNQEAHKRTCLERYGVEHHSQCDESKDTQKQFNLSVYGVEHYFQTNTFREKFKQTMFDRYGVEHALQNNTILEKCKTSHNERYGSWWNQKHLTNMVNFNKLYIENNFSGDLLEIAKYFNFTDIHNLNNKLVEIGINITASRSSSVQKSIEEYVCTLANIETNQRILPISKNVRENREIDIFVPDKNFGIEVNGVYWHSWNFNKNIKYHIDKYNIAHKQGIEIFNIFDFQWHDVVTQDIIKSMISAKLGKIKNFIYARKCVVREVSSYDSSVFLTNNHIQGKVGSNTRLGLYYNDELVSLMTFIQRKEYVELNRFCSKKFNIVTGGFSKLLNYYILKYNTRNIVTFSDRLYSTGSVYNSDFEEVFTFKEGYFYWYRGKRYHRSAFMKHKILQLFGNSTEDNNLTETELILKYNILRVYDAGKIKFKLKDKK